MTASSGKMVDLIADLVSGLKIELSLDKHENNIPRGGTPNQRVHITWNIYAARRLSKGDSEV